MFCSLFLFKDEKITTEVVYKEWGREERDIAKSNRMSSLKTEKRKR